MGRAPLVELIIWNPRYVVFRQEAADEGEDARNDQQLFLWRQANHPNLAGWYVSVLPEWRSTHYAYIVDEAVPLNELQCPYDAPTVSEHLQLLPYTAWLEQKIADMSTALQSQRDYVTELEVEAQSSAAAAAVAPPPQQPPFNPSTRVNPARNGWFDRAKAMIQAVNQGDWDHVVALASQYSQIPSMRNLV